ncbi:LCP family protein [Jeotgalibacillus aurantiacus]|uniref:LCP family protein n=1 Tax=Jeotgalibacillus aurantiacus TaxID=2763266 RepID=UPI001D0AD532|nr:LCP family protein [Jeotgalibacillus aurantiacus]
MDRKTFKKQNKAKKTRKRILMILLPIFILCLSGLVYGGYLYTKAQDVANESFEAVEGREQSDLREEQVNPDVDNVSVLFLGLDESKAREDMPGFENGMARSDVMILATLNNEEKTVKLTSIPRDTLAYIDEVGYEDKINHAHAFGGPRASMESVEDLLGVPVDYYVRLNFYAFMDVVDALGGVEVEVPFTMYEQDSSDQANAIVLEEGRQTLKGEEALAFVRSRHQDSDIARGERQQEVMEAILSEMKSVTSISSYANVIDAIGDNLKTNMRFSEMREFISYATNSNLSVDTHTLQGEGVMLDGTFFYQVSDEELANVQEDLRNHLDLPSYTSENSSSEDDEFSTTDNTQSDTDDSDTE